VQQLVVDPVMISTSGHALAEGGVAAAIIQHLFPLATLITPNIVEASLLLGKGGGGGGGPSCVREVCVHACMHACVCPCHSPLLSGKGGGRSSCVRESA
jgi:hypothetical protein